ncbi:MAG: 5-formyltetrahydrofolate cyclo-ligase [Leptospiraceae bacterium]|nr:5-formyltetrahydrofolate cyclo-ligase [Leptospiraceae bacterium]MCP5510522.1 5-formyltetrahydrofolate cyclo-ligase [Leptospiraceae bacterium]
MEKSELRKEVKKILSRIPSKEEKDRKIGNSLLNFLPFGCKLISYRNDSLEVSTEFLNSERPDLKIFYPKILSVESGSMEFLYPEDWKLGKYQIPEPIGTERIQPEEADRVLIPALGFNSRGFRLGRGAGFYDRSFSGIDAKKLIGLTYSEVFPLIFKETIFDISVGQILTPEGVFL